MNTSVFVIVNPAAGRGQSVQRLAAFQSCVGDGVIAGVLYTREPGDEERLASLALEKGASILVAVGGDGTCSGIANAVIQAGGEAQFAVIPSGTGNDFAKTLGIEKQTPQQIAALILRGAATEMDVGRADGRYFLNSCGFGFDASVLEGAQRVRLLKGDAVYIFSALRQLLTYRGIHVSVNSDANADARKMLMVTVSNGRYLGGAFRIAPNASVVDGELDVGFFGDAGVFGRVRIFARAFSGTHLGLPTVNTLQASSMAFRFSQPPKMEVDGELRQAESMTVNIECLPRALSVIAAPGYPL
jgi:diacylglycerol kinase (ATP)